MNTKAVFRVALLTICMIIPLGCQFNQTNCVTVKGGTCDVKDISHVNNATATLPPSQNQASPTTTSAPPQNQASPTTTSAPPQNQASESQSSISIVPTQKVSNIGVAIVFDPPSNVRKSPNGDIICSVRERATINIYGSVNDWYYTDVCGMRGVIHSAQVKF